MTFEMKMQEAREDGREEMAIDMARDMLRDNKPIEEIAKYTKLSKERIQKLAVKDQ